MIPFRSVNVRNSPGYRDGWQRHHLIPQKLGDHLLAGPVIAAARQIGFSLADFASNGVLLPATERDAVHSRLPLHAGPHPGYNRQVAELISASSPVGKHPVHCLARLWLVQAMLRRRLTGPSNHFRVIDEIDLSQDSAAHQALDAEVEALLARFAVSSNSA